MATKKTAAKKTAAKKTAAKRPAAAAMTAAEYIAALEEPRRSEVTRLHELVTKTLPKLECRVQGALLGYGPFRYVYESGRSGETFRIAVSSRAGYISLYATGADERGWVAERYASKLPRASIGKSCVRFKRLDDLDPGALKALLRETVATKFNGC